MEAGQTIAGKYRLNRRIGMGGMASVWSATNVFTEREFAIKCLLPQVGRTPEAARRFLLEAKVSARINHPYIIEVIDVGQAEDGSLFLVMELLHGASLDVVLRRQQPPMALYEFLGIMRSVAEALGAAHRCGVIHRDLKPTNVFLHKDRDGRTVPKVLDFGVSKVLDAGNDSLTVVGTILGSPLYMSPEQAMGAEGIDGRTDVFAFGSILFEALSGERAYTAANLNALIVAIATTPPKSIDDAAPQLPEALRALVRECMVKDKAARLSSFDEIVARLGRLIVEAESADMRLPSPALGSDPTPEPPPVLEPTARRRSSDRPEASNQVPGIGIPRPDFGVGSSPPMSIQALTGRTRGEPRLRGWLRFRRASDARSKAIVLAAGGLTAAFAVLAAAGFAHHSDSPPSSGQSLSSNGSNANAAPPQQPPIAAAPEGNATNAPPLVSVDSLPVAVRAKTEGRLSIGATPGVCSIYIDGVARGATPTPVFGLTPGAHRIDCMAPSGKVRTTRLVISEGASSHYEFSLLE
ncbi:MAG: protein kinase [Polyangiaceae bacterium]